MWCAALTVLITVLGFAVLTLILAQAIGAAGAFTWWLYADFSR